MTTGTVSVVVLSYNRPELLRAALASVMAQTHRPAEVLVVDNRSPRSQEIAAVVAEFPDCHFIANPDNRGFARGMNTGLRAATGDYILLSEDDIILEPDALAALLDYLADRPEVGLCSGLMLNRGSGTVRCAGGDSRLGTRYWKVIHGEGEANGSAYRDPFDVTYIPGALMFARRAYLEELGGFREDFFMYFEDDELCQRVLKSGRRIAVVPACRVRHCEPAPGSTPAWVGRIKLRNFLALYVLHAPPAVLPAFALRYGLFDLVRSARRGRRHCWDFLVAWSWVLLRLPCLLRDRWTNSRQLVRATPVAAEVVGSVPVSSSEGGP
jgi:GT2 family glycosyltransferase